MSSILDNSEFQKELDTIAQTTGQTTDAVWTEANANLIEMRGQRKGYAVKAFAWLSRYMQPWVRS